MNPLHLEGWDVKLKVTRIEDASELSVQDGRTDNGEGNTYVFSPRKCPYDSIVLETHSGYVSLQALHWLSRNDIPVFMMNYDGTIISSILPPIPVKADLRAAQFEAVNDSKKKFKIARACVEAKFTRSFQVLEWLGERYNIQPEIEAVKRKASKLPKACTIVGMRSVEAHVARKYWEAFRKCLPERLSFQGRSVVGVNYGAVDPVNIALNYGYGFLQCEVRMAINAVGFELGVGFLHEGADYQTKQALVFDLMEPFRFLVDLAVIQAFETGRLDVHSFYFHEQDYSYHFEPSAKGAFLDVLREVFNSGVRYKGRVLKWDTVIQEKTVELGRFLKGSWPEFSFNEPNPELQRLNGRAIREAILRMNQKEAKERGIGKSTLHYLRRKATGQRSFRLYGKVKKKLHAGVTES